MSAEYVSPTDICDILRIKLNHATLRKWAEAGKVRYVRSEGIGKRVYHIQDVRFHLGYSSTTGPQFGLIYARVRYRDQHPSLVQQVNTLKARYPTYELISEYAAITNLNRKGLRKLLQRVFRGDIKEIMVTHRNVICSYPFEFIEWILGQFHTKLVVLNSEADSDPAELAENILDLNSKLLSRFRRDFKDQKNSPSSVEGSQEEIQASLSCHSLPLQPMCQSLPPVQNGGHSVPINPPKLTLLFPQQE